MHKPGGEPEHDAVGTEHLCVSGECPPSPSSENAAHGSHAPLAILNHTVTLSAPFHMRTFFANPVCALSDHSALGLHRATWNAVNRFFCLFEEKCLRRKLCWFYNGVYGFCFILGFFFPLQSLVWTILPLTALIKEKLPHPQISFGRYNSRGWHKERWEKNKLKDITFTFMWGQPVDPVQGHRKFWKRPPSVRSHRGLYGMRRNSPVLRARLNPRKAHFMVSFADICVWVHIYRNQYLEYFLLFCLFVFGGFLSFRTFQWIILNSLMCSHRIWTAVINFHVMEKS